MNRYYIYILIGLISGVFVSCDESDTPGEWGLEEKEEILTEYIERQDDYSITLEALKKTYVYNTLATYGPYTFFCPNNDAWQYFFEENGYNGINDLETDFLSSLFEYHILPFEKKSENFENGPMSLADTTISGHRLLIDISGGLDSVVINNKAVIIKNNVETWNGIIHEIDKVLNPPIMTAGAYLKSKPQYGQFAAFLEEQGLMDTLSARYSSIYPYPSNEFSVFALTNQAMDGLQRSIDSLHLVDMEYESRVARDPDYANKVMPNQVHQLARSFILSGTNYVSTMYSGYKKTLGQIPYGDGMIRMKIVAKENRVLINDAVSVGFAQADYIVENGLIHETSNAFVFLKESPVDVIYSAFPIERWNTNLGAVVSVNNNDGYMGDPDQVYGIANLEPERVGAEFWVEIPNVPAGKYKLTLITKKQGSRAKIIVDDRLLEFEGTESDGSYHFSYLLGNRGRVDNLDPNPCSKSGLYLFEIPTGIFEVNPEQDKVSVKLEVRYLNPGGAKIAVSAIIFEPLAE